MRSTPETVVWLVRHGASTFNLEGRCQGCCDTPELTEMGRVAAHLTGERLRGVGIGTVISSPLRRALETAREITAVLRPYSMTSLESDSRLREVELPLWEGLPTAEIPNRFPEQFRIWRNDPWQLSMSSNGEEKQFPTQRLYQRTSEFLRDTVAAYAGRSILLVTHAGAGRALLTTALGLGPALFHSFQQSNCGISRLRFSGIEAAPQLELLNDTAHLDLRLPKLKAGKTGVRWLLIPSGDSDETDIKQIASALQQASVGKVLAIGTAALDMASRIFPHRGAESVQEVQETALRRYAQQIVPRYSSLSLFQVAVIAPKTCLRGLLQQLLVLPGRAGEQIALAGCAITAVHRPAYGKPVLQAANMFEPELTSRRV